MRKLYVVMYRLVTYDYKDQGDIGYVDSKELAEELVARLRRDKPVWRSGGTEYAYQYGYRAIDCGESMSDFEHVFSADYML